MNIPLKQDLFKYIVEKNPNASWTDIFVELRKFNDMDYQYGMKSSNVYLSKQDVQLLEDCGLDCNFTDRLNNNLVQHIYYLKLEKFSKSPDFFGEAIEYVFSKTTNIYRTNRDERNLLFYILKYSQSGYTGEKFFDFYNKYPDFNLHQVDYKGQNLLNHVLYQHTPIEMIDFLLEQKLSIHHLDDNNNSVLHFFMYREFSKDLAHYFNILAKDLDVLRRNYFNETLLGGLLKMSIFAKDSELRHKEDWIEHVIEHIQSNTNLPSNKWTQLITEAEEIYNKSVVMDKKRFSTAEYPLIEERFNNLIKRLSYLKLSDSLETKEKSVKNKI